MKLFEDLIEASAKFADKATKVASEAYEQSKVVASEAMDKGMKKAKELQLENDLSKAQKQLGELYFVMRKANEMNEDLLTQYYNNALKIEAELDALKREEVNENNDYSVEDVVEETKETVEDVVEEIKEAFDFNEEPAEEVIELSIKACPSCGAPAGDTDIFCAECGTKLTE